MAGPLFIVSTGRTGTHFIANALEALGADAYHEPGPQWLRYVSNAFVAGRLSQERACQLLRAARAHRLDPAARPYAEASCLIYGLVAPLLHTFPAASVVQVVRDPRTYVQSAANWGAYRFAGRVFNVIPYRRLAPTQFEPWSLLKRLEWMRRGQLERLCWAWTAMNRAMRQQGLGSPRFVTVRFEDVFNPDRENPGLEEICSRLEIEARPEQLQALASLPKNISRPRRLPEWQAWPLEARRYLRETCAEEASCYRYDLPTEE